MHARTNTNAISIVVVGENSIVILMALGTRRRRRLANGDGANEVFLRHSSQTSRAGLSLEPTSSSYGMQHHSIHFRPIKIVDALRVSLANIIRGNCSESPHLDRHKIQGKQMRACKRRQYCKKYVNTNETFIAFRIRRIYDMETIIRAGKCRTSIKSRRRFAILV